MEEAGIHPTPAAAPLGEFARIQWRLALRPAAAAGCLGAVLMFTPVGALGLGMLGAGFLGWSLYRRKALAGPATALQGAKLGLVTGVLGFAFFSLFRGLQVVIFHKGDELRTALVHAVDQAASRSADPQAQAVAAWLKSPDGVSLMIVLSLLLTLIMFMIFASVGGALGAVILRNRTEKY